MSWEIGGLGGLAVALFAGLGARARKGPHGKDFSGLEGVAETPQPGGCSTPPPLPPIPLVATDVPPPPVRLKAPHRLDDAARRFLAYLLEIGEAGPLRSATVYGLYVEWATEDEGREALPDNRFLPALNALPGVSKVQTSYPVKGKEDPKRSYRWWFEEPPQPKRLAPPKGKANGKQRRRK